MSLKVKSFFTNPLLFFLIIINYLKPEGLLAIAPQTVSHFFSVWDKFFGVPIVMLCLLALIQDKQCLCKDTILYFGYRMAATLLVTCFATHLFTGGGIFRHLWMLSAIWYLTSALKYSFQKTISRLAVLLSVLVVANLISILVFPNGMYHDANQNNYLLGYNNGHIVVLMPALFFSYQRWYYRKKRLQLIITWVAVYTGVFLTHSTTTKIGLLVLLILIATIQFPILRKYLFSWKTTAAIIAILFFGVVVLREQGVLPVNVVHLLDKDASFTARTVLWDRSLNSIRIHPWFGIGDSTEINIGLFALVQEHAYAHNEILDVLVKSGFIGLILYLNCIANSIRTIKGRENLHNKIWLAFMTSYWISMMVESYSNYKFYYFYFVMLIFPRVAVFHNRKNNPYLEGMDRG